MLYGLISGITWGLDTVILGIACAMVPFLGAAETNFATAALHDVAAALILLVYMGVRGRLGDTIAALKTRSGKVVMLGALLGGPIGMSGYLAAISNIGAGNTAVISAFYPAVGTLGAVLVLREKMSVRQIIALGVAIMGVVAMGAMAGGSVEGGNVFVGIMGALLCVFGWGIEAVILAWGMKDDAVDNETALQLRETTSALAYVLVVLPLSGTMGFTVNALFTPATGVVMLAGLAGVISYLYYYKAIDAIGAARGMALNISYSAWAVVFSALLVAIPSLSSLGAIPGPLEIVCCIAIMVGTVLSATPDWSELGIKSLNARSQA